MTQAIVGLFPKELVRKALDVLSEHGVRGSVSGGGNGGTEPSAIAVSPQHARRASILLGRLRKRGTA
jgi:hypothetical protein